MLIRDKIDSSLNSNGIRFVLHRFELNKHFISENFERSAQITHSSMEKCKNSKEISHLYRSDLLCNHCYSIEFPSKP